MKRGDILMEILHHERYTDERVGNPYPIQGGRVQSPGDVMLASRTVGLMACRGDARKGESTIMRTGDENRARAKLGRMARILRSLGIKLSL